MCKCTLGYIKISNSEILEKFQSPKKFHETLNLWKTSREIVRGMPSRRLMFGSSPLADCRQTVTTASSSRTQTDIRDCSWHSRDTSSAEFCWRNSVSWSSRISERCVRRWCSRLSYNTIQYNNVIYRALFTKRPEALTWLAVTCSAK